jgi:carbonic anhydrase
MGIVSEARDRLVAHEHEHDDLQLALEHEAIKVSLGNLRSFPFIAEREEEGVLKLHGAWFAIASGLLHVLDEDSGLFSPVG